MSSDLLVERDGPLLRLTVNRPERRNALALAVLEAIGTTLAAHAEEADLRAVLLTGAGDKAFAAGGDLKELDGIREEDDTYAMSRLGRSALDRIREFPLPVVAALNGPALGGGAELALACDLRVAAPRADIAFLQGQLNVTTAWGGGIDLVAALGPGRALDLLIHARRIPPDEALRLGLVQRVCGPDESFTDCVDAYLKPLLKRPPQVLRAMKAVTGELRRALHERLAPVEEGHFAMAWLHPDHWEAAAKALAPRG